MRRNQTNNPKNPMKKKQKLDGRDLLIESRLVDSEPSRFWMTGQPELIVVPADACLKRSGKTASAETIRSAIEQAVGKPVVLDRPVSGKFMFVLTWDSSKPDSLRNALEQQGLVLIPN